MKKYRTRSYGTEIVPVDVLRETAACVYISGRQSEVREGKVNAYHAYHDTWEAAHAHLVERAVQTLARARLALQRAQDEYGNVKGMRKPADA